MSWDPKAERIHAQGKREIERAEAEKIRVAAEIERAKAEAELDRQAQQTKQERKQARRHKARQRREELVAAVTARLHLLPATAAIGSPAALACKAQYTWASEVLHLGLLAPLVPAAIEGATWYVAYLTHNAIANNVPAGLYRLATWTLAGVAAGFNAWHGAQQSADTAVAYGLFSLLGIGLWELTTALGSHRSSGRSATQIRRAAWRRVRYPRLSLAAASLGAARELSPEQAWEQAWLDRYGLAPGSPRPLRKVARTVLAQETRRATKAAKNGDLAVVGGELVWRGKDSSPEPSAQPAGSEQLTVQDPVEIEAAEGVAKIEQWLASWSSPPGTVLELPPPAQDEEKERAGGTESGPEAGDVPAKESGRTRRSRIGRRGGRRSNLERVRELLEANPGLTAPEIATQLKIGGSTARRLVGRLQQERAESSQEQQAGGEQ